MQYRADIDGLRAIAILAVVAFHLDVTGFDGGFVGVDIFFVISGYLITSNILQSHERGRFAFSEFYFRRVRRLLPALIATIICTFGAAALVMTPYDLVSFSHSAVAAMFSVSNFLFFSEAGYWDTASEFKPLLHTWSLGVEEQFYLIWPALILLLLGSDKKWFMPSLCLLGLGGAILCVAYSSIDTAAAFYLLPFRVFQFAAGALVIVCAGYLQGRTTEPLGQLSLVIGLVMVGVSVHWIDETIIFPGWVILVPTLGSFLLLLAGALNTGKQSVLLANPIMGWLGRVSYSMYLVHWPIVSLYRYQFGLELDVSDQLLLAVITAMATVVLHYGVEMQFYTRKARAPSTRDDIESPRTNGRFALRTLIVLVILSIAPLSASLGDGWSWRFPSLALTTEEINAAKKDRYTNFRKSCLIHYPIDHEVCRYQTETLVLVIGNSHEPDGLNFMKGAYADRTDIDYIMFGTVNECADFQKAGNRFQSSNEHCQTRLDALLEPEKLGSVDLVLYASNRPFDASKTQIRSIQVLTELKRRRPDLKLATIGGFINTRLDCARHVNETGTARTCALPEHVIYFAGSPQSRPNYAIIDELSDYYIDRVTLLCRNRVLQNCQMTTPDGTLAFYDGHHLSRSFAEMSGRMYRERHGDFVGELLREP